MLDAVVWGLVQGLTEFLPISSSGHLALVPAFLAKAGIDIGDTDLATTAVLHLGTLLAVLVYYREDVVRVVTRPRDPRSRRLMLLVAVGTIPALIGFPLRDALDDFESSPRLVGGALLATAVILAIGNRRAGGDRRLEGGTPIDAVLIGLSQALALVPGISRSGSTITAGLLRGFDRAEAARFSFLLAVPAIAGGGLLSLFDVAGASLDVGALLVGLVVAAVSGYLAIATLIRILVSRGFGVFVVYCTVVGLAAIFLL
ncbi:MAG TPA: undecaprenyl-diphosphate phosphatase [Acidimicrobiia bacterium]|nr:undecaprenyl-diphosphate phosphatase [Acidimicrobiia bacterium]